MSSTTSIVVRFTSPEDQVTAANAFLSAEIDSRPTGLNSGKTSFKPGETVWFLIYMSSNVELDGSPESSAGSIGGGQAVSNISKTQEVTFTGEDTASVQVPIKTITSQKWLGRSLGTLEVTGNRTTLKVGTKGVGVCKLTYTCDGLAYSLKSPATLDGETSFSIVVLVNGRVKE